MYPNLHICNATSIHYLPQRQLLPYSHLSSLCRIARNLLSSRLVHAISVFHKPWCRHFLAKRITSHGQKSSFDMLRGFHPMGCNPNDTRMIVSYHMSACVFSHSRSVRPQILSLLTVIYRRFHICCSDPGTGSKTPASSQTSHGFKPRKYQFSPSSSKLTSFLTNYRL